jgi:hypothetical protein
MAARRRRKTEEKGEKDGGRGYGEKAARVSTERYGSEREYARVSEGTW